ncbi:MAG: hypothetical protein HXS41_05895 [Theionarchaea archaeon]|nr:hypothetical protein [Theionarchaea archaeon]MBU7001081.1 hypothetical protein [Theionarchaea archaeon]MBU7020570.1 hypothetical protein [Theionarchaea archaeon]MBU7034219.1 hypothetical protein [Theionarchaea archaeon]MBU7039293.1 hypothetical protein [Theionarchaea archaeon]
MKVLPLLFLVLALVMQEANPEITVEVGTAEPNTVVVVRVLVHNPNTAEVLWNNVVRIEETPACFVPVRSECSLAYKIYPGETDIGEVTFQVTREAEAGEYPILITLSGGVGSCEEGCAPYFIEQEVSVRVRRIEPEVTITHRVEGSFLVIQIENSGISKVLNMRVEEETLPVLSPGDTAEVTIEKKSSFTVTYEDEYGKKFTRSYSLGDTSPEDTPQGESSIQSAMVILGMIMAYVFKRTRD